MLRSVEPLKSLKITFVVINSTIKPLPSHHIMAEEITGEHTSSSAQLDGRVAIVEGASRGIGRAIAIHLHSLGASVVLNYASASEINASSSATATASYPFSNSSNYNLSRYFRSRSDQAALS